MPRIWFASGLTLLAAGFVAIGPSHAQPIAQQGNSPACMHGAEITAQLANFGRGGNTVRESVGGPQADMPRTAQRGATYAKSILAKDAPRPEPQNVVIVSELVRSLTDDLTAAEQRIADHEAALAERDALITELLEQADALSATIAIGEQEMSEVRLELAAMVAIQDQLESELGDHKNQVADLILDRDQLLSELTARQRELEAMGAESELVAARITALETDNQGLSAELNRVNNALSDASATIAIREAEIIELAGRLNIALVDRVELISRYRTAFFGQLRDAIGDHDDVRIVGDRFVLQSEVLFESGSASLGTEGRARLAQLAATLLDIADRIPGDVDWILRVDGHTDVLPINTREFPSNWELSAGRAISVVEFLIAEGVAPNRLAAAGFSQFAPLVTGGDEDSLRANRRIEFSLDQH